MKDDEIKNYILSLIEEKISERDLAHLIQYSINIAQVILKTNYWRQLYSFTHAGYSPETLASRCIEDLFLIRNGTRCNEFTEYFNRINTDLSDESTAETIISLRKLVHNSVYQTLCEIAGEVDPSYKKIIRNVQDVIRESQEYYTVDWFNEKLIYRNLDNIKTFHKLEFPQDELLMEFTRGASSNITTKKCIDHLFDIVENQNVYRIALSFSTITITLRDYFSLIRKHEEQFSDERYKEFQPDSIDQQQLQQLIYDSVSEIHDTILKKYESKKYSLRMRVKILNTHYKVFWMICCTIMCNHCMNIITSNFLTFHIKTIERMDVLGLNILCRQEKKFFLPSVKK